MLDSGEAMTAVMDHRGRGCRRPDHCCPCDRCYTLGDLGDDRCIRCGRQEAGLAYVVNEVCRPCDEEMSEENE